MRMHNPPHPGDILHSLWLEPLGLTITATAEHLKLSRKTVSELIHGHSRVSPGIALRLEMAFGKSAQSWLAHQAAYDLWQLQSQKRTLKIPALAMT